MLPRTRSRLILLAALVAFGPVAAACDVAFQGMHDATAVDKWERRYTLAEGGQFELSNRNGAIELTASADASTLEVVAERKARGASEQAARDLLKTGRIVEHVSADAVRLEVTRDTLGGVRIGGRVIEVAFKVKVPKNAVVKVSTRNGAVRVAGLSGSVNVQTTNGEITGESISGTLDAGTSNGDIKMQVSALGKDGIRLDTTNGGIDLRVPADTKATIAARWTNGSFDAVGLKPEGEQQRRRYSGTLNGGGPRIELATTNGGIKISSQDVSK